MFSTTTTILPIDENTLRSYPLPAASDADSDPYAVCAYTLQAAAADSGVEAERTSATSAVSTLLVGSAAANGGGMGGRRPTQQQKLGAPAAASQYVYGVFELEASNHQSDGAVEPRLVLRRELDRETTDRYELILTAFDCIDRQRVCHPLLLVN